MPRKSHNTHMLSYGGDRTHLYPHATGWEGIDAAVKRSREVNSPDSNPINTAYSLLASLRDRCSSLLDQNGWKMKTKDTRKRVIQLIGLIESIPEDQNIREHVSRGLQDLIDLFEKRGHKIGIQHV